jgi:hypothetical protein
MHAAPFKPRVVWVGVTRMLHSYLPSICPFFLPFMMMMMMMMSVCVPDCVLSNHAYQPL